MDYPALDESAAWQVATIFRQIEENPHYLDSAPWSADLKDWFARWTGRQAPAGEASPELDDLEAEARELFSQMKAMQSELADMSIKDKLSYVNGAVRLLDKLLILQERAANVKANAKFQAEVMSIIQDVLEPAQRTIVMDRLKLLEQ